MDKLIGQVRCWIRESAIFNNGMLSLQQQNFPSIFSSRINKTQWKIGQGYQGNNWVRRKVKNRGMLIGGWMVQNNVTFLIIITCLICNIYINVFLMQYILLYLMYTAHQLQVTLLQVLSFCILFSHRARPFYPKGKK